MRLCSRITCICVRFLSSDFSVKISEDETTKNVAIKNQTKFSINRYRRKLPKVDASIFDSALSHTRRSEALEKRGENSVSTLVQIRLWTSFESPPVSVNKKLSRPWIFFDKYIILTDEIHCLILVVYKKLWNLDRWMGRMKNGISIS